MVQTSLLTLRLLLFTFIKAMKSRKNRSTASIITPLFESRASSTVRLCGSRRRRLRLLKSTSTVAVPGNRTVLVRVKFPTDLFKSRAPSTAPRGGVHGKWKLSWKEWVAFPTSLSKSQQLLTTSFIKNFKSRPKKELFHRLYCCCYSS